MAATAAAGRAPPSEGRAPPSETRQKTFVVENAEILDNETQLTILRLVMMEVGRGSGAGPVVLEHGATGLVSINLDNIPNPDVIRHIYNIVRVRRAALDEPAHCGR